MRIRGGILENMVGGMERAFDFNQAGYKNLFGIPFGLPKNPEKMVTGMAIGQKHLCSFW